MVEHGAGAHGAQRTALLSLSFCACAFWLLSWSGLVHVASISWLCSCAVVLFDGVCLTGAGDQGELVCGVLVCVREMM